MGGTTRVDQRTESTADAEHGSLISLGLDRLGILALWRPWLSGLVILALTVLAGFGFERLKVDDSLSELFRMNTPEFRQYLEIDRRFPSSEYDVLVVVEGQKLLEHKQLDAFSHMVIDLQLEEGVNGLVSMLSARGQPDATGYAPPIVPDELPEGQAYTDMIKALRTNEIVSGKFLSADGTLALVVISLDRAVVADLGAKKVIGGLREAAEKALEGTGLRSSLTGAPVMQLEIRNAVERDQLVYNGLGLAFGAGIAMLFFRRLSLMLLAALPPVLAVVWSLGLLGWLGFKLNLFINVMTPLVMVMGFADSMQVVSAIRIRLREGDKPADAIRFAVQVVGPACVLAHGCALLSFLALLTSDSGLIQNFGHAGALATVVSYIAVIGAMPIIGLLLVRDDGKLSRDKEPADRAMDTLGTFVGWIVDRVVAKPGVWSLIGLVLFLAFSWEHMGLQPRYRLADQVPDREQALDATGRIDQKLTGANPVHVMIEWTDGKSLYDPATLDTIASAHAILEKTAGLGNVWSLESLRRWLKENGDENIETVKKYVGVLPEHLVRRFIAKEQNAVLVTGRLPDVDASQILPVVQRLDKALDEVRKTHPGFKISVTGLPAIAARNSSSMIHQLNEALAIEVVMVSLLLGLAFRSVFVGAISLLPGLFPVVAAGAILSMSHQGLEFASVIALIVIFGLGVDSLIHFLNRLRREERSGEHPSLSIRRARVLVGPAIILTTIVLAFGLGVTIFSDLPSLRLFGTVCAITLLASLVGDLVFLPALIALWRQYTLARNET
jgi:predicted RND superfamily exporter protein